MTYIHKPKQQKHHTHISLSLPFFCSPALSFFNLPLSVALSNTQKHTKPCTMLIPVKLSLSFTAVTVFLILSLWSVIVQMMIIRGLYSHLISEILNCVSVRVCACVWFMILFAVLHVQTYFWGLMLIHSCHLQSNWSYISGLSEQK